MIKKTLLGLAVLLAGVLAFAATRPDTFRVERSALVQAPPEAVYAQVSDFHRWSAWSPWEKLDPDMKRTHSGAPAGVGAEYAWTGNSDVGTGRMEILEAEPASRVAIQLDFIDPWEASNLTEFTLSPEGDATRVTWAMTGENSYMGKVMSLFMDMDELIGADFEKGLAGLGAAARQ